MEVTIERVDRDYYRQMFADPKEKIRYSIRLLKLKTDPIYKEIITAIKKSKNVVVTNDAVEYAKHVVQYLPAESRALDFDEDCQKISEQFSKLVGWDFIDMIGNYVFVDDIMISSTKGILLLNKDPKKVKQIMDPDYDALSYEALKYLATRAIQKAVEQQQIIAQFADQKGQITKNMASTSKRR